MAVHCSAQKLSGTASKNLNLNYLSTFVQSRKIQIMWFSPTGISWYMTEHLVKTDNNLRIFIVILLYGLTGTCNGIIDPIGPLYEYFVLWQIL